MILGLGCKWGTNISQSDVLDPKESILPALVVYVKKDPHPSYLDPAI